MSKLGFHCYKSFYCFYNLNEGNLEKINGKIVISSTSQIGVKKLWSIAFLAEDAEVREEAIKFLVDLYSYFAPSIQSRLNEFTQSIWGWGKEFTSKDPENSQKVMITIRMIKEHISLVEGVKYSKIDKKSYLAEPLRLCTVRILKDKAQATNLSFSLCANLNIVHLRNMVSHSLRIPKSRIILKSIPSNKALDEKADQDLLSDYPGSFQAELKESETPTEKMPSYVIANNEQIQQYFMKYMAKDEKYGQEIWLLMKSFPLNEKVVGKLLQLDFTSISEGKDAVADWQRMLQINETSNVYVLIYYFYLIGRLIWKNACLIKIPENYIEVFVEKQGLAIIMHYYNTICSPKLAIIPSQCRMIHYILKCLLGIVTQSESAKKVIGSITEEKLIQNICANVFLYVNAAFPSLETIKPLVAKTIAESIVLINAFGNVSADAVIKQITSKDAYRNMLIEIYGSKAKLDDTLMLLMNENIIKVVSTQKGKFTKFLIDTLFHLVLLSEEEQALEGKRALVSSYSGSLFELLVKVVEKSPAEMIELEGLMKPHSLLDTIPKYVLEFTLYETLQKRYVIDLLNALLARYPKNVIPFMLKSGNTLYETLLDFLVLLVFPYDLPEKFQKPEKVEAKLFLNMTMDKALLKSASRLLTCLALEKPQLIINMVVKYRPLLQHPSWRTPEAIDWNISTEDSADTESSNDKQAASFVGLENPSCLCYMNSVMQQLFMSPAFRKAILEVVIPQKPDVSAMQHYSNLAYQMTSIFNTMKEKRKPVHSVAYLCNIIKDYDQRPLSIHEQRDADEFLNLFSDRLETSLKESSHPKLVQSIFGGCFANEIICIDCPHKSINKEDFMALQLTVSNKKNIYESLQGIVDGEALEGANAYSCDRCDKKVKAKRRATFKYLPNTLIVVLKRFEFDLQRNIKKKINDRYEFPMDINFEEYSLEYLSKKDILERKKKEGENAGLTPEEAYIMGLEIPKEYYKFQLRGVVLHSGSSESGHYTSLAMDRETSANKWYKFDDSRVSEFNTEFLQSEAFGGLEEGKGSLNISEKKGGYRKTKSAYMLVYERVAPFNMEKAKQLCEDLLVVQDINKVRQDFENAKLEAGYFLRVQMGREREAEIKKDSESALKTREALKLDHLKLFTSLITREKIIAAYSDYKQAKALDLQLPLSEEPPHFELHKFFAIFVCNTILRLRIRSSLPWILRALIVQFTQDLRLSMWMLETFAHPDLLGEFFISCPEAYQRFFVASWLASCFGKVYSAEKEKLAKLLSGKEGEEDKILLKLKAKGRLLEKEPHFAINASNHKIPFCLIFLNNVSMRFVSIINDKASNNISQYAYLISCLARTGPEVQKYFIVNNFLSILSEFLVFPCEAQSNKPKLTYNFYITQPDKKYAMGLQSTDPKKTPGVKIIYLSSSYDTNGGRPKNKLRFLLDTFALLVSSTLVHPLSSSLPSGSLLPHSCTPSQHKLLTQLTEEGALKTLLLYGKSAIGSQAAAKILLHFCKKDIAFSKYLLEKLITWYCQSDLGSISGILITLELLLRMDDDFQAERALCFMNLLEQAFRINTLKTSYIPFSLMLDLVLRASSVSPTIKKIIQQEPKKYSFLRKWADKNDYPADGYVNWLETPKRKIEISRDLRPPHMKICKDYNALRCKAFSAMEKPQPGAKSEVAFFGYGDAVFSVLDLPSHITDESQRKPKLSYKVDILARGEWHEAEMEETAGGHIIRFSYVPEAGADKVDTWMKRGNYRIDRHGSRTGPGSQFYEICYKYAEAASWG